MTKITGKESDLVFNEALTKKLSSPGAPSAMALAREVNIHQSTLSRWVREYAKVG